MPARLIVFLTIATLVVSGLHVYLSRRLIRPAPLSTRARRLAQGALLAASLSVLLCFVLGRFLPQGFWTRPMNWIGFTALGGLSILWALTLARDALLLAWRLARRLGRGLARRTPPGQAPPQAGVTRRTFLMGTSSGVVLAGGLLATVLGFLRAIAKPVVERQAVWLEDLPPDLDGFTIAQISDLHLGPTLRRAWLEDVVQRVNALGADVIAVTGDLIDGRVAELSDVVKPLARLRAKRGVYFVTGNHEYYWDADAWVKEVRRLGLDVLQNEHRVLKVGSAKLLLAGVTDLRAESILPAHASDPAGARAGAPPTDASILLAHQPRSLYAAREAGYDLQLSGHTHGGQYFPWNLVVHLFQPAVAGLYRFGALQLYVNRGTGYWGPPLRSGAKAEITLIELKRPDPA